MRKDPVARLSANSHHITLLPGFRVFASSRFRDYPNNDAKVSVFPPES